MTTWLASIFTTDVMKKVFGFFFDNALGEYAVLFFLAAGLVVGFAVDQRGVGKTQAIAEVQANDAKQVNLAGKARSASRSNDPGRVLDPYLRDDK